MDTNEDLDLFALALAFPFSPSSSRIISIMFSLKKKSLCKGRKGGGLEQQVFWPFGGVCVCEGGVCEGGVCG